jgi:hypothetical protein
MSDNPNGADNQQESLSPEWVVGFVDGEGCFYVGINRQPTMKVGWQILSEARRSPHDGRVGSGQRASWSDESRSSESSEAIRRTSGPRDRRMIWSELRGDTQR